MVGAAVCRYAHSSSWYLLSIKVSIFSENKSKCIRFYVILINTSYVRCCDKVIREIRTVYKVFILTPKNVSCGVKESRRFWNFMDERNISGCCLITCRILLPYPSVLFLYILFIYTFSERAFVLLRIFAKYFSYVGHRLRNFSMTDHFIVVKGEYKIR